MQKWSTNLVQHDFSVQKRENEKTQAKTHHFNCTYTALESYMAKVRWGQKFTSFKKLEGSGWKGGFVRTW